MHIAGCGPPGEREAARLPIGTGIAQASAPSNAISLSVLSPDREVSGLIASPIGLSDQEGTNCRNAFPWILPKHIVPGIRYDDHLGGRV